MAVVVGGSRCNLLDRSNVKALLDSIDTILCDCDGVIWASNTALPGAVECVVKFKQLGKRFFYVTNNSAKTRKEFVKKCDDLGFPAVEEDVIGSGYVAAQTIKNRFKYTGKAYVLGTPSLAQELCQVGVSAVGIGPDLSALSELETFHVDDEVKCVVVGFDPHFNYVKAGKAVTYLNTNDSLFVSTNTDSGLPSASGRFLPGTGSMLAMVQTASQRSPDVICGKPHLPMFEVLMDKYQLDPKKTLMIGDRLDTDILLAGRCGLQSLLVLSGFSSLDEVRQKSESGVADDQKQIPMFYLPSLADLVPLLNL